MRSEEVSQICEALQELQVSRRFIISLRIKQTNACGALIRRALGFTPTMTEDERKEVKNHASSIVKAYFSGKPLTGEDARVVEAYAVDLSVVAAALEPMLKQEASVVKEMERLAKDLPVHAWVEGVKGFGLRALAVLVGEAGNLSNYPNQRHLWKRLGLAPYDGLAGSSWRYPNRRTRELTAQEWTDLGYKKQRRAEMHAFIGDPLLRQQIISAEKSGTEFGAPKGKYGAAYVGRREHTKVTHPDWDKGHSRDDGLRIMTKELISDLWSEWRGSIVAVNATTQLAPAELIAAE